MKKIPVDNKIVTPLLAKAYSHSQPHNFTLQSYHQESITDELIKWGYYSVFDIVKIGPERFKRRHHQHFNGQAEHLYKNALSYATQLIHQAREQGLRNSEILYLTKSNQKETELPSYSDLFPEPWDNFCKPGSLEAINSPLAYLLELYNFSKQLELDASEGSIGFSQRRPDIEELRLDKNNSNHDLPALQIVNEILSFIAADYIDKSEQTGKPVNKVLEETYYPYHLPFSLSTLQITLGLAEKNSSLAKIIQPLQQEIPNFCRPLLPNTNNNILLAATQLSQGHISLLMEKESFSAICLTKAELQSGYLSSSTSETLMDANPAMHGYIVPKQQNIQGPDVLSKQSLPAIEEPYDKLSVICTNTKGETVTVILRSQSVQSYYRIKRRLQPFNDKAPYPRKLKLSWHQEDNPDIVLASDLWLGEFTIQAQLWENQSNFLTFKYQLSLSDNPLTTEQLFPQAEAFFNTHYGISVDESKRLPEILFLIERIQGKAEEIEQIISWGDFAPIVSSNITLTNPIFSNGQSEFHFPLPFQIGACYLNHAMPEPVGISQQRPRSLTATTIQRFDRLQRLIRLHRWLNITPYELDELLIASMQAEHENNLTLEINLNTLRVIGLFRYLNSRYSLPLSAFTTIIHALPAFAVSGQATFLDKVFNQPKLFDEPFIIDNHSFNYMATRGSDARTIKQLCAGLKITIATFQIIAEQVNTAFKLDKDQLTCSLPVVSSLYRLVTIPRLFKLTPEQGIMLINTLHWSSPSTVNIFAGEPRLSLLSDDGKETKQIDILDIILTFEALSEWLQKTQIQPEQLCLVLQTIRLPIVATDSSVAFFGSLLQGIPRTQITETNFQANDIPPIDTEGDSWLKTLSFLFEDGLVKPFPLQWKEQNEDYLKKVLTPIVESMLTDPKEIEISVAALTQVILQGKTAQEDLLSSSISREYGINRDLVPMLMLWIDSSVADILQKISQSNHGDIQEAKDISQELLNLIYKLTINAMLIKQLRLTSSIINVRLIMPNWLGLAIVDGSPLSLQEIWVLSCFHNWVSNSQFSEDELIGYISLANYQENRRSNDDSFNRDCAEELAKILEWDADEIELATQHFTPPRAKTVDQIDWLRRMMSLSHKLSLSVTPLLTVAELTAFPPYDQIASLGEAIIAATQSQVEG